jgi:argininosuccinate lyase
MAHVSMLGNQGIIPPETAGKILGHLLKLQDEWNNKKWTWLPDQDDVQMTVEKKLIDALGMEVGGRMHTCRSRNDQVPLDSKLYTRNQLLKLREKVIVCAKSFLEKAKGQEENVMVSYTHVQHAQPVSVAFWLSHYAAHLLRDLTRLKAAYDLTDQNVLGAGAISGTSFPIDRLFTTKLLGFQKVHEHALDATSSRDFMTEVLTTNATLQTLFSRLAEELILWSSWEFRTITLDDGFAMGSSMMPQKKNPGPLELMRGRAGRMIGLANAGFIMMKGLPSGYNRDFHEEKEILVESIELILRAADVIPPLIRTTTLNLERMKEISSGNFANATELANYLVHKHKMPFRHAHDVVGTLVGKLSRAGKNFSTDFETCLNHLKECGINAPKQEIADILDPTQVMLSYNSLGGTGKKAVLQTMKNLHQELDSQVKVLEEDKQRVTKAYNACRSIASSANTIRDLDSLKNLLKKYSP